MYYREGFGYAIDRINERTLTPLGKFVTYDYVLRRLMTRLKVIDAVSHFVPKSNIIATTNCGMAPMRREIAEAKLMALGAGAALAREKLG